MKWSVKNQENFDFVIGVTVTESDHVERDVLKDVQKNWKPPRRVAIKIKASFS